MPQAIVAPLYPQLQIQPPQIVDLGAGAADIYDKNKEPRVVKMFVHNIGVNTVKYSLNQVATANVYHDVLAADTGVANGLGSKEDFDFTNIGIDRVSVLSAADPGKLAVIKYVRPL